MALGVLSVAALTTGLGLLTPLDPAARAAALTFVPLVFLFTLIPVGRTRRKNGGTATPALPARLLQIRSFGGTGYYGAMAAATFAHLEVASLRAALADADSVRQFVVGELPGCSAEAVFNIIRSAVWFLQWFGRFPVLDTVLVLAGTVMAFQVARWMFVPAAS